MAVRARDALQHSDDGQTVEPHTLKSVDQLRERDLVATADKAQIDDVARRFSVAITAPMVELINPDDPNDPIARQFVPSPAELDTHPLDMTDPIGDEKHSPVPGIVHRYPDRVLLMPVKICPVYCRFCFRRETVGGTQDALLNDSELNAALDYIRTHDEIWEVILSGGDPFILSPRRLQKIVAALSEIEHVEVIRVHTRVPVVDPQRINSTLLDALNTDKALFVILHSNHARELTEAALQACARLIDKGIPMLSQSVLLKGINDDAKTLEKLLRKLVANRIKPYYLHHADRAPGTAHFRTTLAEGQALMKELRGQISGLCRPHYVLDLPGGYGKVPVVEGKTNGQTHIFDSPSGERRYYSECK